MEPRSQYAMTADGVSVVFATAGSGPPGKGFPFADRGEAALCGFEDPVRLFEVLWREE